MNYLEILKKQKNYIESSEGSLLLKNTDLFFDIVNFIERDIEKLNKDEKLQNIQDKTKEILSALNIIKNILLEDIVTDDQKNFLKDFLYLTYNWINNTTSNVNILTDISILNRMLDMYFSTLELIKQTKKLTNKINNLLRYNPNNIDLSKHYLKSLLEE